MRTEKIELRVTPEFKAKIKRHAQAVSLSVTAYLLTAASEKMHKYPTTESANDDQH